MEVRLMEPDYQNIVRVMKEKEKSKNFPGFGVT